MRCLFVVTASALVAGCAEDVAPGAAPATDDSDAAICFACSEGGADAAPDAGRADGSKKDATSPGDGASPVDSGSRDTGFDTSTACFVQGQMFCGGRCIDVQSDALNCGTCGRSCMGQPCAEGACTPITLSSTFVAWGSLAQDVDTLYFTNSDGTLRSVPKAGGPTRTIADGLGSPIGLGVDATYAYISDSAANKILKIALSNGAVTDLVTNQSGPQALVVDATNVYWVNYGVGAENGSIMMCAKTGCNNAPTKYFGRLILPPAGGQSGAMSSLAVGDTYVYYGSVIGNGEVHRAPIAGGPDETVFSDVGPPGALVTGNGTLAFLTWGTAGKVRIAAQGAATSSIVAVDINSPLALAMTDTDLYWTMEEPRRANGGQVFKCPRSGCVVDGPQLLAKGTQSSGAIVVDAANVYWLSNDANVYRTPR
jgi:hypothetical protein